MAFQPPQEDGEHFSKFNEAWLKMKRIDNLQNTINFCIINPTDFNLEWNVFNYQVVLSCCASIIAECWGKLNDEDRDDALAFKNAMEKTLRKYPIHSNVKDVNDNSKNKLKYNPKVWETISSWLFKYNLKCREFLSKTGYDSPDASSFDEDDF